MTYVDKGMTVEHTVVARGMHILYVDDKGVWASRGSRVFHSADAGKTWRARYAAQRAVAWAGYVPVRLARRLLRGDISFLCPTADGEVVCISRKAVIRSGTGEEKLRLSARVPRGTRPLMIASVDGVMYWGEYFSNRHRDSVHIFRSTDAGASWDIVYTFAPGEIRHVHGLIADRSARRIWVLTGDRDHECTIRWTDDHFTTLHMAFSGDQMARAVSAIPVGSGLIWGTDIPSGGNRIVRLGADGVMSTIAALDGPSFYAQRCGDLLLISTGVEPASRSTQPNATLRVAVIDDLGNWQYLLTKRKDMWPTRLFQYGNIVLPAGPGDGIHVWASGTALSSGDGFIWRWNADAIRRNLCA